MLAALDISDFAGIALLVIILAGGSSYAFTRRSEEARLRRVEKKLDMILKELNLDYADVAGDGLTSEVKQLADAGKKIDAIKLHREQTGQGLKEAKDAVEAYMYRQA